MIKQLILSSLFVALLTTPCFAYDAETDTPKLETLEANVDEFTAIYKSALEKKRDYVDEQISQTRDALVTETDAQKRRDYADHWDDLRNQSDELSDKIRVINAGEVVKLSNTKDRVVAFLTHQ